ncbi:MAG: hypothetical protein AB7E24_00335 [Novosphingobium sp.]
MNENWFELGMIAFIMIGIAVAIRRNGQANPQGTGKLAEQFGGLDKDVRALRGDMKNIDRRVGAIEISAAKASDIARLERQLAEQNHHLAKVSEIVAASVAAGEQRGKQLDMIYQQIVEGAMKR